MKIFMGTGDWEGKVNFIDEKNVLVGYEITQNCCERPGWYVSCSNVEDDYSNSIVGSGGYKEQDNDFSWVPDDVDQKILDGWMFDILEPCQQDGHEAIFRITKDDKELFLHLFNQHEGHYWHGFVFEQDSKLIRKGEL